MVKSSDFERLGDWQRKQILGFNDALNDLIVTRNDNPTKIMNSSIFTDRSTLQRRKVIQEQGKSFVKKR